MFVLKRINYIFTNQTVCKFGYKNTYNEGIFKAVSEEKL